MASAAWTILRLLQWSEGRLQKEGIATPRLDAEVLLTEILGMDRVGLYTHFDQPLELEELARFKTFLQRRLRREPVAYILGRREFWSLVLKVSPDVLIPRPETEVLVSEALKILAPRNSPSSRILEIGTGSGAISVALARELPSAEIVATDLSTKALDMAKDNALQNGVGGRIEFFLGDLFQPLGRGAKFDLVITNPPYIPEHQFPSLAPEIRNFEPRMALVGGADGFNVFRRVLPAVADFLNDGGWFLTEIGEGQDQKILRMAEKNPDLGSFDFVPDLAGIRRVFKARKTSSFPQG